MANTISFDAKQAKVIHLALEVLINTLDGKNDALPIEKKIIGILREYSEELFASVHSQGG